MVMVRSSETFVFEIFSFFKATGIGPAGQAKTGPLFSIAMGVNRMVKVVK